MNGVCVFVSKTHNTNWQDYVVGDYASSQLCNGAIETNNRISNRGITCYSSSNMGSTDAVAMGFALKDSVASLVAGVMIILDRPFQVGDRVNFGEQYGDITAIDHRGLELAVEED